MKHLGQNNDYNIYPFRFFRRFRLPVWDKLPVGVAIFDVPGSIPDRVNEDNVFYIVTGLTHQSNLAVLTNIYFCIKQTKHLNRPDL